MIGISCGFYSSLFTLLPAVTFDGVPVPNGGSVGVPPLSHPLSPWMETPRRLLRDCWYMESPTSRSLQVSHRRADLVPSPRVVGVPSGIDLTEDGLGRHRTGRNERAERAGRGGWRKRSAKGAERRFIRDGQGVRAQPVSPVSLGGSTCATCQPCFIGREDVRNGWTWGVWISVHASFDLNAGHPGRRVQV